MGSSLRLVGPSSSFKDSYRSLVKEFVAAGEPLVPFPLSFPNDDFDAFLERLRDCERGEGMAKGWVPHTSYWLIRDEKAVVGVSNLRHEITDKLRKEGGHIGYGVRPTERGRGYSRELLALTLIRARERGIAAVLLTCAKSNVRSVRTITANGGVCEGESFIAERGEVVQRYWIQLGAGRDE